MHAIEMADQMALLALYAEYNRSIDAGDARAWAETFIPDGTFHHPARSYTGVAELREFVNARTEKLATHSAANQKHWNDSVTFTASRHEGATGTCLLMVVGSDRETQKPIIVAQGRYYDSLVKSGDKWLFRLRTLQVL